MPKYAVRVLEVNERWATLEADDVTQARRIVLGAMSMVELEPTDPELDDVGDWSMPAIEDTLACWIDDVTELEEPR